MALILTQTLTAIGVNLTSSFLGVGGTTPYTYSVLPNGAGGTIDSTTGVYSAPSTVNPNPEKLFDTIQVVDAANKKATAQIMIGTALLLFCEIIQQEMVLPVGRVYLWDQKIFQPTDSGLYIAVNVLSCKPFGNTTQYDGTGAGITATQTVNMYATLQLDVISRGPEARDRKEEVILALNSDYAQSQQDANSFLIGKIPPGSQFVNLSNPDGAAIPYRFNINVALQYAFSKTKPVPYFDTFLPFSETSNP